MKVAVLGSIGYGGFEKLKEFMLYLENQGFDIITQLHVGEMDYSNIDDFRDKIELSKKIIKYDFEVIAKADVLVLIANKPSYGAAMEVSKGKELGKKIVLYAPRKIPTPWPVGFSDYVVQNKKALISMLRDIEKNNI